MKTSKILFRGSERVFCYNFVIQIIILFVVSAKYQN